MRQAASMSCCKFAAAQLPGGGQSCAGHLVGDGLVGRLVAHLLAGGEER
jgi:hypothetical protein